MHIDRVIENTVLAIFEDKALSKSLFLKGGAAIRLLEQIDSRLSIDIDLSTTQAISRCDEFFSKMERALKKRFERLGFDVFDFWFGPRPKKQDFPKWWSGWLCEFKLVPVDLGKESDEKRRRSAFIPHGSNSSIIEIEISEYEYCGLKTRKNIQGVMVQGYSKTLIILEKLRAICQQHSSYRFTTSRNRARDFYDIYQGGVSPNRRNFRRVIVE